MASITWKKLQDEFLRAMRQGGIMDTPRTVRFNSPIRPEDELQLEMQVSARDIETYNIDRYERWTRPTSGAALQQLQTNTGSLQRSLATSLYGDGSSSLAPGREMEQWRQAVANYQSQQAAHSYVQSGYSTWRGLPFWEEKERPVSEMLCDLLDVFEPALKLNPDFKWEGVSSSMQYQYYTTTGTGNLIVSYPPTYTFR